MLLNWYQDGQHTIGKHSDDERQLVPGSPIYSFSYGQQRDFKIASKPKSPHQIETITLSLPGNSLLMMGGEMQKWYTHEVPKRALSRCPGRRINVTVRHFKD
jgi:alkylated DNA repair dioxygenase AlkB